MKANPEKFQVMFLSPMRQVNQFPNTFTFENLCIKRESTCKLLALVSMRKMERIQERALRFVLNASYDQLLTDSGISSLHLCRVRASAVEVYKCLDGINPAFMCNRFTKRDSKYNFRDQNAVLLPNFNSVMYGRKSFRYVTIERMFGTMYHLM